MSPDLGSQTRDGGEQLALDWTLDPTEARVLAALRRHCGIGRAVTVPRLAAAVRIGPREVQKVLRRLCVDHGYPVLSGGRGVWLAESAEELLRSYREQRRKAISTIVRQRQVYRRHLARLQGQQDLPGERAQTAMVA